MKLRRLFLAVAAPAALAAFQWPADDFGPRLAQQLRRFYALTTPEKVYLQLDRDAYAAGETIWCKGYVAGAAPLLPDSLSRVLYVDVVGPDQKLLLHHALAVQDGGAPGSLPLPPNLPEGLYTLRAYTSWMRNTPDYLFSRVVPVVAASGAGARAPEKKPPATAGAVQFFPEGGELVAGLPSTVAFKATDAAGRGIGVQGTVQDEQGTVVAQLRSQHLGMGRFELQPAPGRRYTARLRFSGGPEATYPLPAAQPAGLTLQVQEQPDAFLVLVRRKAGSGEAATERVALAAHVQNTLAYAGQAEVSEGRPLELAVPKKNLPAGILHVTLFDGQQVARCERLSFHDPGPGVRLRVQPDKAAYAPHEKVTLQVSAQDAAGRPLAGNFALAVTDAAAPTLAHGPDIRTALLLTADLPGPVEQPGYYFAARTAAVGRALDDLLLTQGWRRFVWKEVLANRWPETSYPRELGPSLGGRVVDKHLAPVPGAIVSLTRLQPLQVHEVQADGQGRFMFTGFSGQDSAAVRVVAQPVKGTRHPQVLLDDNTLAISAADRTPWPWAADSAGPGFAAIQKQVAAYQGRSILLGEVQVKQRAPQAPLTDNRRIYSRPDVTILTKDIPGIATYQNVLQILQGRVSGLSVTGSQGNVRITMRGQSGAEQTHLGPALQAASGAASAAGRSRQPVATEPVSEAAGLPLLLLDGVPVSPSMLATVPIVDFEAVEVLRPGSAAIFGERGGAGALSFLTKHGNPNYVAGAEPAPTTRPPLYAPPRLQRVREFYRPATGAEAPTDGRSSATLYWNAGVRTGATGTATVTFVSAEKAGSFRIVTEGLTQQGEPVRTTGQFQVEAPK
ncbi:TonB-dependent receptor plug domain-containing protein [Microvirga sp. STS02]|uniref:TonB-dependent receptor plug domain-containing protein n=1 Tax=Hymenobacter negativus TaxID=2795026 RepID=UPI0018DC1787|nr:MULTISPECIES: TonB-dependent receptor plug domain-containing protein [Bacteria]MBH8570446.1 TonB-dependent receptor plug domain-containing protein [Hymenobacter negativus]MBR7210185.1 TonB-dependent receptor plug domain-containing protein [Microvirga sp. STS02]